MKITRRRLLQASVALATGSRAWGQDSRPNIVLVIADDLGYGHLSCYGQTRYRTRYLDELAHQGVTLTDFYASAPLCAPSRCCLMTGLHTGHARIRSNQGKGELLSEDRTIAELLRDGGYHTGLFGKWGLGSKTGVPWNRFDEFFGFVYQREAHRHYPGLLWHNDRQIKIDGYAPDLLVDRALRFIRESKRPFFLCLATTLPHADLDVPEDSFGEFNFDEIPFKGDDAYWAQHKPRAALAGMITRLDHHVGSIMAELEANNLTSQTLVIFTSDNGPASAGGADIAFFNATGELRGQKGTLYEGGIRVPFIARWPEHIPVGIKRHSPSAGWDLVSTLLDVAKLPQVKHDGSSLLPVLTSEGQNERVLYWEKPGDTLAQAVRTGRWKALRQAPNDALELYNLTMSPIESQNVAALYPGVVERIEEYMAEARTESPDAPYAERSWWVDAKRFIKSGLDLSESY